MTARRCAWCRVELEPTARADSITCSRRCRQARARFRNDVRIGQHAAKSLRLAYADPPYPELAYLYRNHRDYAGEVNHLELVSRLQAYDGWALSTSAAALPLVLSYLAGVDGWRVASWHRGARPGPSRAPRSGWEPVIFRPARDEVSSEPGVDAYHFDAKPRLTDPDRVIGAKPAAFLSWLFHDLLKARTGDSLDDLYPGSGGVQRAWEVFRG